MKFKFLATLALTTCTLIVIGTGIAKAIFINNVPTTLERTIILTQSVTEETTPAPEFEAINQAALSHLQAGRENLSQAPIIRRPVVYEGYALSTWAWGEAGGQSVLSLTDSSWQVIASGGGAMNISVLEEANVPTAIADQLIERDQAGW